MYKQTFAKSGIVGIAALILVCAPKAKADFTYAFGQDLPCVLGCNGASTIGVAGSLTVDTLGNLTPANFKDWNLSIVLEGGTPITDTPASSTLTFEGNPEVVAQGDSFLIQLFAPGRASSNRVGSLTK